MKKDIVSPEDYCPRIMTNCTKDSKRYTEELISASKRIIEELDLKPGMNVEIETFIENYSFGDYSGTLVKVMNRKIFDIDDSGKLYFDEFNRNDYSYAINIKSIKDKVEEIRKKEITVGSVVVVFEEGNPKFNGKCFIVDKICRDGIILLILDLWGRSINVVNNTETIDIPNSLSVGAESLKKFRHIENCMSTPEYQNSVYG